MQEGYNTGITPAYMSRNRDIAGQAMQGAGRDTLSNPYNNKNMVTIAVIASIAVAGGASLIHMLRCWSIPKRMDTLETQVKRNGASLARIERLQEQISAR